MALPLKYNLRNLFVRRIATLMTVAGVALVVSVLVLLSAMATGLSRALETSGSDLNVIVLRDSVASETSSVITPDTERAVRALAGIATAGGQPVIAGETILFINVRRAGGGPDERTNLLVRGVEEMSLRLRPAVTLAGGRWFARGTQEAVVARSISERFEGLGVGEEFELQSNRKFKVVGTFTASGTTHDSEIWVDEGTLRALSGRDTYNMLLLRADGEEGRAKVTGAINAHKAAGALASAAREFSDVEAKVERDYYAAQSREQLPIGRAGVFIAFFLALAAMVGAYNTMDSAIGARAREFGTLRAIGFSPWSILLGLVAESTMIALLGGVVGYLVALPLNGYAVSTTNWVSFTELAFAFRVTPAHLALALSASAAIGAVGGLLPAWRACRRPVFEALRGVE
ncbi:MAG: ABC transporter permease [Planctomycetes bacterium]|nr:ABC transporter permease [Planctomycetota bacterium]